MKLYLVRHGSSTGNTPGNLVGHSSHPLTEEGTAQAQAVAARLEPLGPMTVYSSDLARAHETAEHIARVWAGRLPAPEATPGRTSSLVVADRRLREIHMGLYEGRSWDDYLSDTELNAAMIADPYHTTLPGGESLAQMTKRVLSAVDDIVLRHGSSSAVVRTAETASVPAGALAHSEAGECACLVAHDGPIRTILNHFLGVLPEKWWALTTTHGGVSLLEWSNGWVNVRFINDTSHLAGLPSAAPAGCAQRR
jgi:broad specificity phosphatase PhoE